MSLESVVTTEHSNTADPIKVQWVSVIQDPKM